MMDNLLLDIADVLLPAILALVGAALFYGAAWLRNKALAIKDERIREAADAVIERARTEIYAAVAEVAQTYVDDLKAAREDGTLTPEEAAQARDRAIAAFKARMSQHALEQLKAIVGDLEAWIRGNIETAVYSLGKSSSNASA